MTENSGESCAARDGGCLYGFDAHMLAERFLKQPEESYSELIGLDFVLWKGCQSVERA